MKQNLCELRKVRKKQEVQQRKAWVNFPELQRYFNLVYNYPGERRSNKFWFSHSVKTINRSSQHKVNYKCTWFGHNLLVPVTNSMSGLQQTQKRAEWSVTFTQATHSSVHFLPLISCVELVSITSKPENPEFCFAVVAFFCSVL